ncbi:MAG: serine/threonine protein kinase [Sandaracinaceae bacterium]|nr:serine/threonine protein kinase [Sandaracinaceae bacterium]
MLSDAGQAALSTTTSAIRATPAVARALYTWWRYGVFETDDELAPDVGEAAAVLDRELPEWTREPRTAAQLKAIFTEPSSEVVFIWCAANSGRSEADLAPILGAACAHPEYREQALDVVRSRIVEGPLLDALRCVPLLGSGESLELTVNHEARARMQILLWEAGAAALQLPDLGKWIWDSAETFEVMIGRPARGTLRGRVLAARCLEVAVCGMSPMTDPHLVGRTLQVLQPLLLHPEPKVWIHAARAFGRLAGVLEPLEGTLLDWVHGATPVLRQRALTAFASLPAERLMMLGHELGAILDRPEEAAWGLAAAAAATPHLFVERRALWERLADRITSGDGGAVAARALARGVASLWRRGGDREAIEPTCRRLRQMARRAHTDSIDQWRRWLEVIAVTDPVDGAERDPLDIELGIENLVRLAAQYDDEEADARAARFASTLAPTFTEARRIILGDHTRRHRAAAINAYEGCARSLALRLWSPMLTTRPEGDPITEPDLGETWQMVANAPAELLDVVRERRESGEVDDPDAALALEVLALKIAGYALDASGEGSDLGPGRGPVAHDTCLVLRKLEGLSDGSREFPPALRGALSALFWRLVDTTRGSALGEVDDVQWLGPFAAWWGLVIDRPEILQQLATALPMIADGVLEHCCDLANETRLELTSGEADGAWGPRVQEALTLLKADGTELAESLMDFARALERFGDAGGRKPELEALSMELVLASERLQRALKDPVRALHPAVEAPRDDSLAKSTTVNAPRMASVVSRAIRAREISLLEVWIASLGPIASALVEAAVKGAIKRTPPPPPTPKKPPPKTFRDYDLVKPLGEGGIGTVWLVRKPGADRFFVLKIPKADALAQATDFEREGILASFVEEAKALAGLYHPNVANIIDRGVENDVPFLVLEYLIGADLKQYSAAQLMTLYELRKVVVETCAGLTALHNAGLVHRDIKPANIWLRLPLAGGQRFDPEKHRDPAHATPLATVVIDFGMVRAMKVSPDVGGKFVAGTPGYIAPEQVLDPVELDGRADVYALAGTIYNVTTGRQFFDHLEDPRQRIIAHMNEDPMADLEPFRAYPAALVKLMRAATATDWKDRPTPLEFGREFAELL